MNNQVKDNCGHLSIRSYSNVAITLLLTCEYNCSLSLHVLGAKRPSNGDRFEVAVFAG